MVNPSAAELLAELRTRRIGVSVAGGRLRTTAPAGALDEVLRERIRTHRDALVALLSGSVVAATQPIPRAPRDPAPPLSFAQRRVWFLAQVEGGDVAYNEIDAMALDGPLDLAALEAALNDVVMRHEILRTTIAMRDDEPVQIIRDTPVSRPLLEIRDTTPERIDEDLQALAEIEVKHRFDLEQEAPFRFVLLSAAPDCHRLLFVIHHIVADGWSLGVLFRELGLFYRRHRTGSGETPPAPPVQYADYAVWQKQIAESGVWKGQLDYWTTQLADAPPLLRLPTRGPRPAAGQAEGRVYHFTFDDTLTEGLRTLARSHRATLYMVLLAGLGVLMHRHSGQDDLVLGSPIANRNHPDLEPMIGYVANTIALRLDFSGEPSFAQLLERVGERAREAYENQDIPFEQVVAALPLERTLAHAPVFQVLFVLQNLPASGLPDAGRAMRRVALRHNTVGFDQTWMIYEDGGARLEGRVEYDVALFDETMIARMVDHLRRLLAGAVNDPARPVGLLPMLSQQELTQQLETWAATDAPEVPVHTPLHRLIEDQVDAAPDRVAVACATNGRRLTFGELDRAANRLAHRLVEQGVERDTVVALLADRNADFLIAMLAVFKAGGAYLPLDPHQPVERLADMVGQADAVHLLLQQSYVPLADRMAAAGAAPPRTILGAALPENLPNGRLADRCGPDDLAYVIFTSGSTGRSKGAMVEQKGMVNHIHAKIRDLGLTADDHLAQTAPQTFDISVWQFLAPLLIGGGIHVWPDEVARDPAQLLDRTVAEGITILEVVPSMLQAMLDELAHRPRHPTTLRWLVLTGEALPPELATQWLTRFPAIPIINAYGPTECSDDVAHYPLRRPPRPGETAVPIGHAVCNMRNYVLDAHLQPVPVGVVGELYIGGVGVGRGYIGDPDRTAKAFVGSPFRAGDRLYRSGDLARFRPDGALEFLGRIDHQVKLRGFRIELAEVEFHLLHHPEIRNAVVSLTGEGPGARLVAHVITASGEVPKDEQIAALAQRLQDYLRDRLPEYMVPSAFVPLAAFPLNPNGKIDRSRLPEPAHGFGTGTPAGPGLAPAGPVEAVLARLWAEILGGPVDDARANFFALGGHSLLATRMMSRVRRLFRSEPTLSRFFMDPTIAGLAAEVAALEAVPGQAQRIAELRLELDGLTPGEVQARLAAAGRMSSGE